MYKNLLMMFLLTLLLSESLLAQTTDKKENNISNYKIGVGLRGGIESGITLKYLIKNNAAFEGILSSRSNNGGARITGIYEIQKHIADINGLSFFYGLGAHIGYYHGNYYGYTYYNGGYYDNNGKWHYNSNSKYYYTSIGVDAILGLEYNFISIPFTIGIDIKPYLDLTGGSNRYTDGAFSVRYLLKK